MGGTADVLFPLAAGKLLPWMCTSFFSVQKTVCSCGHSHM